MTDSEIMLLDAEFWICDQCHHISFPPGAACRADEIYVEWELDFSCDYGTHSWFALLLSEVLK